MYTMSRNPSSHRSLVIILQRLLRNKSTNNLEISYNLHQWLYKYLRMLSCNSNIRSSSRIYLRKSEHLQIP
jgi:hypothetical protein